MFSLQLITLVILLVDFGTCRSLRIRPTYPEIPVGTLEKGKSLQLRQNYTTVQFVGINGTLYSDSFSKLSQITELRIHVNQIREIETGAICSSGKLKKFEIDFYKNLQPPTLTKAMFENCEDLEELGLYGDFDSPATIDIDALEHLSNLKTLIIRKFRLEHLTKSYFKNLKNLTTLSLQRCSIREIDEDAFSELKNLKELEIQFNEEFSQLPPRLLQNSPKLKSLAISSCNISALTWDEFDGLSSLEKLDLVQNRLNFFDAEKIAKYMPNLTELNIELNPLSYKKMKKFSDQLKSRLNHTVYISYKFDLGNSDS